MSYPTCVSVRKEFEMIRTAGYIRKARSYISKLEVAGARIELVLDEAEQLLAILGANLRAAQSDLLDKVDDLDDLNDDESEIVAVIDDQFLPDSEEALAGVREMLTDNWTRPLSEFRQRLDDLEH